MRHIPTFTFSEWETWRKSGIGASEAPAVMRSSPWSWPQKVWEIKSGRRERDPLNYPMMRGIRLEPYAREEYERITGLLMPPICLQHRLLGYMRASFDGFNERFNCGIEIKCPGKKDHQLAKNGQIPRKYLWQLVHLCAVADIPGIDYFSYGGTRGSGVIVHFRRDLGLEQKLIKAEAKFWRHIVEDTPPEDDDRAPVLSTIKPNNVFKLRRV